MSTIALFTTAKTLKQCRYLLTDEYKRYDTYIHNGILLSQKKIKLCHFAATQMDLKTITLNEVSQTEKNKHHMILVTCGI